MSTPETIYLIPGEYEEGLVWCDDPAPDSYSDPDEAVKYVRADTLPVVTDNGKVNVGLIAENERLQARVADLEQAVSVPKQWVDLMRELVKDLISEIKTKQKLKPDERVAEDLGAVREAIAMIAKQEQGHE